MSTEPLNGKIKHIDFIILDVLCMQICFMITHWLMRGTGSPYANRLYLFQTGVIVLAQLISILLFNYYKNIIRRSRKDELSSVLKQGFAILLVTLLILFCTHTTISVSRKQVVVILLLYVLLCYQIRQLNKRRIIWVNKKTGHGTGRQIALFTSGRLVDEAITNLTLKDGFSDHFISAVVLTDGNVKAVRNTYTIPILPLNDESISRIRKMWTDEALIIQPDDAPVDKHLISDLSEMGITINLCHEFMNSSDWPTVEVKKIGKYKVFTSSIKFITTRQAIAKRVLDIIGALVGCALTGILFMIIGPVIYAKSPGPILFTQERIGKNGKIFKIYKFRSMYMNAEERKADLKNENKSKDGLIFKMDDDPRIIGSEKKDSYGRPRGIGNFIRNTSLDEFPQFWNVLKGEMSLVGTRPPLPDEWELYELHHRARMSIKPGITGPWQVNGRSEITDFEEIVKLDREYIENWNVLLDIQMILKTILVVANRRGAS